MNILLIGTGNVATVLGSRLQNAGHGILGVYGRTKADATTLAAALRCPALHSLHSLPPADLYLLAVSDRAITEIVPLLRIKEGMLVHTAGAVQTQLLAGAASSYGVLYPLQTLRREIAAPVAIPFLIDANTATGLEKLRELVLSMGETPTVAGDAERLQYHLSAVIANNFSNFLWTLTKQHCDKAHIDFRMLLPLLDETVTRLHRHAPASVQTGPAYRNDKQTIEKHLALLYQEPELAALYTCLSDAIATYHWPEPV